VVAGWHTSLDNGDFRCWTPLANICPSGTSPPQSICDSLAQPPQSKARESPPQVSSWHCSILSFGWGRTYSVNVVLCWMQNHSAMQNIFSPCVLQAMNLKLNSSNSLLSLYEGIGFRGQSWGLSCDCKSGFKPKIGKVKGQASGTSRDVAALFCQRWSGWEKSV